MVKTWIKSKFPSKTFEQHFCLEHEFHGVIQNHISETFRIKPITPLGLQLLLDGIQINDPSLHLKSKIMVKSDYIKISLTVIDPAESKNVLLKLKKSLVKQLIEFEDRFYSSPIVQYVEPFCSQCVHYQTKPLNQCIATCRFELKKPAQREPVQSK